MAAFNINTFRSSMRMDGARPSQFMVTLNAPAYVGLDSQQLALRCEAASLPPSSIGVIEVPYFGRKIKVAGDREVTDWTISVQNDEDFKIYSAFERWINAMSQNSTIANRQRFGGASADTYSYVGAGTVTQYGKGGDEIRSYKMENVWPSQLSGIQLGWADQNQIERFSVTLHMDWFASSDLSVN